jgi:PAS domain S-box-containing protein
MTDHDRELNKAELRLLNESLEATLALRSAELHRATERLEHERNRRTEAEAALLEGEERFWGIFDAINDAIFVHYRDTGEIVSVNRRMTELYGYSPREARKLRVGDLSSGVPPYTEADAHRWMTMTVNEGPQLFVWQARRRDGGLFWSEVNMRSADFGGHGYLLVTVRDITERFRAEEELRYVRNYLANIIDSMPSLLVGVEIDGTVTQWNRQAATATGISAEEAVGRPVDQVLPEFSPWITVLHRDAPERRSASLEKILLDRNGERRFFDLMLYPLIANGIEGAVVRIEDVTERALVQELMVQTEKMMSVGGLAAGMAHEINNPLGIITQSAQNIERRVSSELPANRQVAAELGLDLELLRDYFQRRQISQFLTGIRDASARASRIVANMLQFSRKSDTVRHPVRLHDLVDRTIELAAGDYDLKKNYDFRSIGIVREYDPDLPDVPVVVVEIEQVVLNLLKNAAQAMAANPVGQKPEFRIRLRSENGYAVLEVADNGPGMDENVRLRVFEPFFTTKEPGVGTGLGLSVSYLIVTGNHQGLMTVESSPGKGTCFTVKLPLAREL